MNPLTAPIEFAYREVSRTVEDAARLVRVARNLPERLEALDRRSARLEQQFDRALDVAEAIEARGSEAIELGRGIESVAREVLRVGERIVQIGERGTVITGPIEGAVRQLGRLVEGIPVGRPIESGDPDRGSAGAGGPAGRDQAEAADSSS